jgi:hypothetical protein
MNKKKLAVLLGAKKKAWATVFDGTNSYIGCGTHASIATLADNAFTAEGFFLSNNTTLAATEYYFHKGHSSSKGWGIYKIANQAIIRSRVFCETTPTVADWGVIPDGFWHHFAITFDDAGDRKLRFFVDGVLRNTGGAGVGAVVDDSLEDLTISGRALNPKLLGYVGWVRISDSIRYTANFTPPSRYIYPEVDANTVRLFKMNEGTGTTVIDYSANAQNGTLETVTWKKM